FHLVPQRVDLRLHVLGTDTRDKYDKFVASQTSDIIVLAATLAQTLGNVLQQLVAGQVAEAVVDGFEAVQIQYQNRQAAVDARAALELGIQVQEEGPRIGQAGEAVGGGRLLGVAILHRIFNSERRFGTDHHQQPQVIVGERIPVPMIQRE